jgi:hypothetical protein
MNAFTLTPSATARIHEANQRPDNIPQTKQKVCYGHRCIKKNGGGTLKSIQQFKNRKGVVAFSSCARCRGVN